MYRLRLCCTGILSEPRGCREIVYSVTIPGDNLESVFDLGGVLLLLFVVFFFRFLSKLVEMKLCVIGSRT